MIPRQPFLDIEFADHSKKSYSGFQAGEQDRIDEIMMSLAKCVIAPGMRLEPIEPEKYYREARVNDGDRVVFRIENDAVLITDVVPHDLIGKYGRKR